MIRTCKLCKFPQALEAFVRNNRCGYLNTCKLCYNGTRPARTHKPRTEAQKARRRALRAGSR